MITVYAIECTVTGNAYIGCTKGKLGKRMREHRCLLNLKMHSAHKMVEEWWEHGGHTFQIHALETLPDGALVKDKRACETKWMSKYRELDRLYNTNLASFQGTAESLKKAVANAHKSRGNRNSPEANLKRRLAQLGKPKGHGAKISATKQAKKLASVMR